MILSTGSSPRRKSDTQTRGSDTAQRDVTDATYFGVFDVLIVWLFPATSWYIHRNIWFYLCMDSVTKPTLVVLESSDLRVRDGVSNR
jgi:hypothetical protein